MFERSSRGCGKSGRLEFNVLVLVCSLLASGCSDAATDTPVVDPPDLTKIDAPVLAQMSGSGVIPVFLLLKTQLVFGPDALGDFAASHSGMGRSVLRAEVIRDLKEAATAEQAQLLELLGSPAGARSLWIANVIAVSLSPAQIRDITESDLVRYVYQGQTLPSFTSPGTVASVVTPARTSAFSVEGKTVPWNVEQIGARRVWEELGVTGEGAVVTMIDNGSNYLHPDLTNNVWTNTAETPNNGVDDDQNGLVDDYYGFDFANGGAEVGLQGNGHGTYTSGIVLGDGTGGTLTGLAPRARLMITRGGGTYGAARAFQYALEERGDVVTMSFSIPNLGNRRGLWRLMADNATAAGLVLVSGAGNFQQTATVPEQQRIPEGIPSVISAGGVDQNLQLVSFSSLGPVDWSGVKFYEDHPALIKPDVAGFPGAGYPVLLPEGPGYVDPNNSIRGNSFSGPHAAGVAALMLSANPELPAWEVSEIMQATARDLGPTGKDNQTGAGLMDAFAAVEEALRRR